MQPTSQTEPMKIQSPNPTRTTSQTANHLTAEGKTKAPGTPAPLLQDVFPESVSTTDSYQKTIRLAENEQEIGAQLQKEKGKKNTKSGRGGLRKLKTTKQRLINKQ